MNSLTFWTLRESTCKLRKIDELVDFMERTFLNCLNQNFQNQRIFRIAVRAVFYMLLILKSSFREITCDRMVATIRP